MQTTRCSSPYPEIIVGESRIPTHCSSMRLIEKATYITEGGTVVRCGENGLKTHSNYGNYATKM
eukprot:scaffold2335_cov175-Amphora_coffeaeformis.AAC.4